MDPRIFVFTAGFNAAKWCKQCLDSVKQQTYQNYIHVVVNDASTDTTGVICQTNSHSRMQFVNNTSNKKWLENAFTYIKPDPEDIVILLDLDDWLPNSTVFRTVVDYYKLKKCWLTYGSYARTSKGCQPHPHTFPFPEEVLVNRSFRKYRFISSHLRTFKGFLWNNLKKEDCTDPQGVLATSAWDCAIMFAMLEMCKPGKILFCPETLYIYNDQNPLNDHRVDARLQKNFDNWFRIKPTRQVLTTHD